MEKPLVSINCITYNHEAYIRQCLDGFLMQRTTFPFEVLVHDDASTDNTQAIILEYKEKYPTIIKPYFQKENQYSKGKGFIGLKINFERAKGKYIALCEGDDFWTNPKKLELQVSAFEHDDSLGLVWGRARCYYQRIHQYGDFFGKKITCSEELFNDNVIPTATAMIRRDLVSKYFSEIRPENYNWPLGDYPMWLFASLNSTMAFIDEELATYRILPESASHSKTFSKQEAFINEVFNIKDFFIKKFNVYDFGRNQDRRYSFLMSNAIEYNHRKRALEYYKSIQHPSRKTNIKAICCRFRLIWLIKLSRR